MEKEEQILPEQQESLSRFERAGGLWPLIILMLIAAAVSVSILGSTPSDGLGTIGPTPSPDENRQTRIYTISYRAGVFSPTNLRIHVGDTVRFKNESIFGVHITCDQLAGFDSISEVPQNSTFSYTFSEVGIFEYHNEGDPDETGTIIVKD